MAKSLNFWTEPVGARLLALAIMFFLSCMCFSRFRRTA
jgi:hypothetical protein